MANYLLKTVFKSIFGEELQPNEFESRLEMQKAVYLLQNMGISVGDYKFIWYKHGPYSQTLQNDILSLQGEKNINVEFSSDAQREINALKKAISKKGLKYNKCQWVECLGSLQYIKDSILPSSVNDEKILNELTTRKPHLNNTEENKMALHTLEELEM